MNPEPGLPEPNQESVAEHAKKVARDGEQGVSRRTFLMKVGIALNALVAAAIATPVVGYLLGPVRRKGGYNSWIALGDVERFPRGRDACWSHSSIRIRTHGTAIPAKVACYVRRDGGAASSRCSRSTARISAARCAGFRSRSCSCAPATAACTTRMAAARRDRRSADCSPIDYKVEDGKLMINARADADAARKRSRRSRTPR